MNIKKRDYQINNNAIDVFRLIAYPNGKQEWFGSSFFPFKYASDYDLFTVIHRHTNLKKLHHDVWTTFKHILKTINKTKDIYFIDFIAGVNQDGSAKHWTPKTIKSKAFLNVLDERSIFRLEVVQYMNGRFIPFSNVFEIYNNNKGVNQEKKTIDTNDSLKTDIKKYYERGNLMKVLKRLFIINLNIKNTKLTNKLVNVFQSDIGMINKIKSDLHTMIDVYEKYHDKITTQRIINNLQMQKETMANQTAHKFNEKTYKLFNSKADDLSKNMNKLVDEINSVVNSLL